MYAADFETLITDVNDELLDPESSSDSSEGNSGIESSCDECENMSAQRKRRAVWSTAMKKKQKQPQ